jgi:ATP-dependent Lhr-like helicase
MSDIFDQLTVRWFSRAIGTPTAVQDEAWPVIASGRHALVSAPTGTGKTLSAFLVFIDRLMGQVRTGQLRQELQLIYVSPLRSLAGDIRENLRRPLLGIAREEREAGISPTDANFDLTVAVRTGDTPQSERRRMIKKPPHILITTPESLYLLLTSQSGQTILHTARWIILDELHALIDTKRGAHLMLSLARLDRLCGEPLQRIGLSATIRPLDRAAVYLSPDPVAVVAPKMEKMVELAITSPFSGSGRPKKDSVWQEIAVSIYNRCLNARSVIAFVEGRAYAEKLAFYVNQLGGDGFARTHHGSVSKEQRLEVEQALRDGALRLLCATSSMELGIDVGEIDQVFQIGCPRTISSAMQRLGRAGHNPGRVSVMHIFPRTPAEALCSGLTAAVARAGGVEHCHPPRLCLDVLAQHLVSMATGDGYDLDEVMAILARADPFRDVTRDDVRAVLAMLAGDHEHRQDIPVRPRVLYDRIHEQVKGDAYSRMLAVSTGGTIPDRGLFTVRTQQGVILGQLDEEFVFEARVGDKFLLGSFAWRIDKVQKDAVIVTPGTFSGARPPFWKGEIRGRSLQTGQAFGQLLHRLGEAHAGGQLEQALIELGMDADTAVEAENFLGRQFAATGVLPDDRTILVEHFIDANGSRQLMAHSVFGRQVNEPLAILAAELARRLTGDYVNYVADDDGFLLFPYGDQALPEGLLLRIPAESARVVLEAVLPVVPLFNMAFRYNAARALMMGVRKTGRQPLWVQRLRAAEMLDALAGQADHPLIRETRRECLEDYWDLPGVEKLLRMIRAGVIRLRELHLEVPSPLSLPLRQQTEAAMMYDYAPTTPGMHRTAETALEQAGLIEPAPEQLSRTAERARLPGDEEQLHSLLMIEGDLQAGELAVPVVWLEKLVRQGKACYIEPGLWIAAEQADDYQTALAQGEPGREAPAGEIIEAKLYLVRRLLRYRGAQAPEHVADRYGWTDGTAQEILTALCGRDSAVMQDGLYYHAKLYEKARKETILSARRQIRTVPAERYAALLTARINLAAPPEEKLEQAVRSLCDLTFPPAWWESILLPARVAGFRPEQLDALLAGGSFMWRFAADGTLSFHRYEAIDWDADLTTTADALAGQAKIIYEALVRRGASFMNRLTDLTGGESPYDILLELAEKGLACADSFIPVRQWLSREKLDQFPVKQRVRARVKAMTSGRWEIARPLKSLTLDQKIEQAFDRAAILCRETLEGLPWEQAMEILRIREYTGQVRRGFFVEGMSGMQFIRSQDFPGVMLALEQPLDQIIWLPAVDPNQPWGKSLSHLPGRSFMNVPGTTVALKAGLPVAAFERQGKLLRVFDPDALADALQAFVYSYAEKRLYPQLNRIPVRQYPPEAIEALTGAGFIRDVTDYVLYREYRN